jgi:hypothetical protein
MPDQASIRRGSPWRVAGLAATLALLAPAASGCASPGQRDPLPVADPDTAYVAPARWPGFPLLPDGRFPIAGWCAPPVGQTTDARYDEYARAGFTVVLPPLEDRYLARPNLERLDVAGRRGLYVIVRDLRLHPGVALHPGWRAAADSVAATYSGHAALLGYFLADEPEPELFGALGAAVRRMAMRDPRHPVLVNLLGENSPGHDFQGRTYSSYLRYFLSTVQPAFYSLDNYVLMQDGADVPTFDSGWDSARTVGGEAPFWAILLLTPHGRFRQPTEGEMAWQANLALAHGARGIIWFTYWTPNPADPTRYRQGPIAYDGSRNPSYGAVTRVNAAVGTLGRELGPLRCVDVRHTGQPPRGGRRLDADPDARAAFGVTGTSPGDLTLGLFADSAGRRHVLVVNRNYRKPVTARIVCRMGCERWTGAPGRYETAAAADRPVTLPLEPGGAALLRLAGPETTRRP